MALNIQRFTKRPATIHAVQIPVAEPLPDLLHEIADWCGGHVQYLQAEGRVVEIPTLEGTMRARRGDWIIRGVAGEFYPCKPDIFDETYAYTGEVSSPDQPPLPGL